MDLSSQLIPAAIIVIANVLSGSHESRRWETVTMIFGLIGGASIVAIFITPYFLRELTAAKGYLMQVGGFCLLTALSRDYEKWLRPLFPWNW